MKNSCLLCLLILLVSSCSFTNRFAIYNKTDHDLLIRYRLSSISQAGFFSRRVVAYEAKRGGIAADTSIFNSSTRVVTIRLRKAHYVTIGGGFCATYHSIKNVKDVFGIEPVQQFSNLQYLEIISENGELHCQGDLLASLITKDKLTLTRIDIKQL
jgi:hypothetical protein